ncbi:MAG: LuxR family transcriptional regulator [Novosphingobium sp.]|nr:LuxR family transcriptional regulator [Novosphingobium sp.]MCP5401093.1 LuxR family transcriptional regulator [Novosphingobium sp.]
MGQGFHIVLVDGDTRRRAAITHRLSDKGIHVEPFEALSELVRGWPQSGVIFVCDEDDAIDELMTLMGSTGKWFPVVAFSEAPSPRQIVEAVQSGAVDYVSWPFEDLELTTCLERTRSQAESLGPAKLREAMARSRIEQLSGREREVLSAVASGLSNQLIANQLGISCRTVESHRANILNKIGATHISEAIRVAIEASLVH